jgi:uncharacterized cupredoxin-like copper-binding protein
MQFAVFDSPEFMEAAAAVDEVTERECDFEELAMTAVDYGYEDLPEERGQQIYRLAMVNEGEELHEAAILRVDDEDTEASTLVEQLEQLPDDQFEQQASFIGIAFAAPGEETSTYVEFTEPGRYIVVCFIPEGTTAPDTEGTGPPHYTLGMVDEFVVQ